MSINAVFFSLAKQKLQIVTKKRIEINIDHRKSTEPSNSESQ